MKHDTIVSILQLWLAVPHGELCVLLEKSMTLLMSLPLSRLTCTGSGQNPEGGRRTTTLGVSICYVISYYIISYYVTLYLTLA